MVESQLYLCYQYPVGLPSADCWLTKGQQSADREIMIMISGYESQSSGSNASSHFILQKGEDTMQCASAPMNL